MVFRVKKPVGSVPASLSSNSLGAEAARVIIPYPWLLQKRINTMLTSVAGVCALRKLRRELQEDAGDDFPEAVLSELLVLYDVCKGLELNVFQIEDILGQTAWEGIKEFLDTSIVPADNLDLDSLRSR